MKINNFWYFIFMLVAVTIILFFQRGNNEHKYFIKGLQIDSLAVLEDERGNKKYMKDFKKPLLVYKYSELNCNVCVDSALSGFKRLKNKIPIVYISDYKNRRDLYLFKRINNIKNNVYRIDYMTDADTLNFPYVFVLDESNDFIQKSFFIPRKENPKEFEDYLSEISAHYNF